MKQPKAAQKNSIGSLKSVKKIPSKAILEIKATQ